MRGRGLASLAALAWPVTRGVAWSQVRQDVGLHAGRGFLREVLIGPLVYASGLPLTTNGSDVNKAASVFRLT